MRLRGDMICEPAKYRAAPLPPHCVIEKTQRSRSRLSNLDPSAVLPAFLDTTTLGSLFRAALHPGRHPCSFTQSLMAKEQGARPHPRPRLHKKICARKHAESYQ